jgi:hypothetical protein
MTLWISLVFVVISPFSFLSLLILVFSLLILVRFAGCLPILFIFSKTQLFVSLIPWIPPLFLSWSSNYGVMWCSPSRYFYIFCYCWILTLLHCGHIECRGYWEVCGDSFHLGVFVVYGFVYVQLILCYFLITCLLFLWGLLISILSWLCLSWGIFNLPQVVLAWLCSSLQSRWCVALTWLGCRVTQPSARKA